MVKSGEIKMGDIIDVSVPTGNFGNIFACYIAKLMGLPIGKLICASNMNNVLTDFLNRGVYTKNRQFYTTISPSMDILISSNLERLLYVLTGKEKTRKYMDELSKKGEYSLTKEEFELVKENFAGYYATEEETMETIKTLFNDKNCLIDTHTAVAVKAAKDYIDENKAERKVLVVSTASPYKFANDVFRAITGKYPENEISALTELQTLSNVKIPAPLENLDKKSVLHTQIIEKTQMADATLTFAKN